MTRYPDLGNPALVDRIPLDARVVLDVGCGGGALAAAYRRRNPRARLFGIERDAEAAALAGTRMERVYTVDVEVDPLPFAADLSPGSVDCLIYGDVLEHLRDPWEVLRQQAGTLAPDGVVLICMPNVDHWSFVDRLLRGAWDYEEQGLFDRTHLRWFNTGTTQRALRDAGLVPLDVMPRVFDRAQAEAFALAMRPALERLGVDPNEYAGRASALQHVWRAGRRAVSPLALVSTRLAPVGGVSEVRVTEPMQALLSEPSILPHVTQLHELPALPPGMPRILVLHRPLLAGAQGLDLVRRAVSQGYVLVCEFDDHPDYIPVLQRPDIHNFDAVHAIQTTTEPLAEVLRQRNPEVAVFPNAVAHLPDAGNFRDPGRLTLFFGGLNREADWPALLPALNMVAERAGERLHFRVVNDRGFFDALTTPHKDFTPLCDYPTYQHLLGESEISFMPLADTPFNRCKSDLKFLEASAHRVAALASRVVYDGSIEDGRTGMLFADATELQQRLSWLVANPAAARAMADSARAHVAASRMLAYQVERRAQWYHSLWLRRHALHATLLERIPELAGLALGQPEAALAD